VSAEEEEERQLRVAALRNAEEILLARNRVERELRDAKAALEKNNHELQLQREWFQVTLSSIGDAVITTDAKGFVTFLNPVAESMTGWTSGEAAGKPLSSVFKIINEHTGEPVDHPVETVLREGRIVGLANHTSLAGRHGKIIPIEDSAAPIRDNLGNLTGAVMVFHDVTARRQADAALNASELRFRTIFNQAAVGIALTDLTGKFLQANQKFADVFGYSVEELQQRSFLHLTHPLDVPRAQETLRRLTAGEVSDAVIEKRCLRKDGGVIWSLSTITVVKDVGGRPQHLVGMVEDVTNRKRAEEAQARLVAVIQSSDDSIISLTLEGIILSWKRNACMATRPMK
jgi:PAS domain S-box-containing protein